MISATNKSQESFIEAQKYIPGGVNSPVRAFKSINSTPIFINKGEGSYVWDIDGNKYIDYIGSWGPLILGHADKQVIESINKVALNGATFGAPTLPETELAKLVCQIVPSVEMVRFVNSGTEAVVSTIRLARAYTKKNRIIKFSGCYHGCVDSLLIEAGSGVATLGLPNSPGIPIEVTKDTTIIDYNDSKLLEEAFKIYKNDIAAVIIEPVVGNSGCIIPQKGYLELLRKLCSENNALLIFDEVMTGFRLSLGGAQEYFNVIPDLTTMGKIIGGGLPVGAYGGRKEIMQLVAPSGPVYQAGTLSGNPLAMAAGITTLSALKTSKPYKMLDENTKYLCENFKKSAEKLGIAITINNIGSMFSVFFTSDRVFDYNSAKKSDTKKFAKFYINMLKNGIYLAPSQFESCFLSVKHTQTDLEKTCTAFENSIKNL